MNEWLRSNRWWVITLAGSVAVLAAAVPFAVRAGRASRVEQCAYALKSATAAMKEDSSPELRKRRVASAASVCDQSHEAELSALRTEAERAAECDRMLNLAKGAVNTQPVDVESYLSRAAQSCGTSHDEEVSRLRSAAQLKLESKAREALNEADPPTDTIRQTLLRLSRNPFAVKPVTVSPPDQDEPDHTTYEYSIPGVGEVVQWRKDGVRWAIFLSEKTTPEFFAPKGGLKSIVEVDVARWWRVTSGPFQGCFVLRTPGGIEVRSKSDVCSVGGGLPEVVMECAYL